MLDHIIPIIRSGDVNELIEIIDDCFDELCNSQENIFQLFDVATTTANYEMIVALSTKFSLSQAITYSNQIVNEITSSYPLLIKAIITGNSRIVKHYLQHTSSIDVQSFYNEDIFSYLANSMNKNEIVEIAELLLKHGANINGEELKQSPLHSAVSYQCVDLVKYLIEQKANINLKSKDNSTPLAVACGYNCQNPTIFKLLVDADANPFLSTINGSSCVFALLGSSRFGEAQYLIEKHPSLIYSRFDMNQMTLLHQVMDMNLLELILTTASELELTDVLNSSHSPSPNRFLSDFESETHYIHSNRDSTLSLCLSEHNSSLHNTSQLNSSYHDTFQHNLSLQNLPQQNIFSLDNLNLADLNINDTLGNELGMISGMSSGLTSGLNSGMNSGMNSPSLMDSPTVSSIGSSDCRRTKIVLTNITSDSLINNPLYQDILVLNDNTQSHESISSDNQVNSTQPFHFSESVSSKDPLGELKKSRKDKKILDPNSNLYCFINSTSLDGTTPLLEACCQNHLEKAKLLLKHGADPNIPDQLGLTSIHAAFMTNNPELIHLLLEYDADVAKVSNTGRTTLTSIFYFNPECHIFVELICNHLFNQYSR